jgi:hypothetical protein
LRRFLLAICLFLLIVDEAKALYDVQPGEASRRQPGSIIRIWPLEGASGTSFRILYRSTSPSGEPIAVSGAIFIPPGPAPADGRDIITWAHPTSGVVELCAPSLMPDLAGTIWGLADNYRESEARAVLDSVRAARDLPDAGASNRFAVWGHSQGGHASLYTGESAASYAPDLKLVGWPPRRQPPISSSCSTPTNRARPARSSPPWRSIPGQISIVTRPRAWSMPRLPPSRTPRNR